MTDGGTGCVVGSAKQAHVANGTVLKTLGWLVSPLVHAQVQVLVAHEQSTMYCRTLCGAHRNHSAHSVDPSTSDSVWPRTVHADDPSATSEPASSVLAPQPTMDAIASVHAFTMKTAGRRDQGDENERTRRPAIMAGLHRQLNAKGRNEMFAHDLLRTLILYCHHTVSLRARHGRTRKMPPATVQ